MPQIKPRLYRPRRLLTPTAVKAIMTLVSIMGGFVTAFIVGLAYSAVIV